MLDYPLLQCPTLVIGSVDAANFISDLDALWDCPCLPQIGFDKQWQIEILYLCVYEVIKQLVTVTAKELLW